MNTPENQRTVKLSLKRREVVKLMLLIDFSDFDAESEELTNIHDKLARAVGEHDRKVEREKELLASRKPWT